MGDSGAQRTALTLTVHPTYPATPRGGSMELGGQPAISYVHEAVRSIPRSCRVPVGPASGVPVVAQLLVVLLRFFWTGRQLTVQWVPA